MIIVISHIIMIKDIPAVFLWQMVYGISIKPANLFSSTRYQYPARQISQSFNIRILSYRFRIINYNQQLLALGLYHIVYMFPCLLPVCIPFCIMKRLNQRIFQLSICICNPSNLINACNITGHGIDFFQNRFCRFRFTYPAYPI